MNVPFLVKGNLGAAFNVREAVRASNVVLGLCVESNRLIWSIGGTQSVMGRGRLDRVVTVVHTSGRNTRTQVSYPDASLG